MTNTMHDADRAGVEALETLLFMLRDEEITDAARVSAAKTLLDRYLPKEDAELKRREAEERAAAVAEARCLLAEFAAAKSAGVREPAPLAQLGPPEPDHAEHGA